jgi:GSH-dependent disulfide-bond oxidoreductase
MAEAGFTRSLLRQVRCVSLPVCEGAVTGFVQGTALCQCGAKAGPGEADQMPDSVTLYHWEPNANSGKPMLTLAEKGVDYESHYIDMLNFDQHKPEYLAVNPNGTIPAMRHGDKVLTESTAIMEYVDEAFEGPPLMPDDPKERWRARWWMKFMDQWLGPSFSMIGWSIGVGPAVRSKDPAELEAAIERIPLPERRKAWRKAIYNQFSEAELAESQRRIGIGVGMLHEALRKRKWIAGARYSLADINLFNSAYFLPLSQPDLVNDEKTPEIMEWLRSIYERPAAKKTWAMARTAMGDRVKVLERESA